MATLLGGWVVSEINNLLVVNRIYHWIQSKFDWIYVSNTIPWYSQILNTSFNVCYVIAGCPAPVWSIASSGGHGTSSTSQFQSHRFCTGKWCQTFGLWPYSEPYDCLLIICAISEEKIRFLYQWVAHGKYIHFTFSYFVHFSQFVPQFSLFWPKSCGQMAFQYLFYLMIWFQINLTGSINSHPLWMYNHLPFKVK